MCPEIGEEFTEADKPFLDGDEVDCPWCDETHIITGAFTNSVVNWAALTWAELRRFRFHRSDRGAIEYVATRATGRAHWVDGDEVTAAYTIGDVIYWPSVAATNNLATLRHERCHVRQARLHGHKTFVIKYWVEMARRGYDKNRYERSARRAERRVSRSSSPSGARPR